MPRGRAANHEDQRDRILAQAAQLFAHRGFPATSMNEIALACGLSKPALYHYYRDKNSLLLGITEGHVKRLQALVAEIGALGLPPARRLNETILRLVGEYAGAQHAHRVLTEDVRFLAEADQAHVLGIERELVGFVAGTVGELRPDMAGAQLAKPLTMLLFGMINWMFTWMRPEGPHDHGTMAPLVAELFLGGLDRLSPRGAA